MANDALLTLPAPTLSATGGPAVSGIADLTVPVPVCEASMTGAALTIPAPAVSATGVTGRVGSAALTLPVPTVSATADSGVVGSVVLTLPVPTVSADTPPEATLTAPVPTLAATAVVGQVAAANLTLSAPSLEATASTPIVGTAGLTLPLPVVSGSAITGNVGAAALTLASVVLAAEGVTGAIGSASLTLPVVEVEASGAAEVRGTATLTLPSVVMTGQASQAASASYSAYALNSENRALTTYSSLPIRGLAKFNGVYLAAGPGGLFVLGGDTDAGALINASVRLAATDFGDPHLKRVEQMYVQYRTTGDLTLKVIINEHEQYDYTLPAAGHTTLAPGRVKIGKGAKGTYWQFDISNRDGADFEFDSIAVDPLATSRKVG